MKAAYINQPGPPESIIVGDLPTPQPTGSQVLVKVAAAAVNPIDTYIRSGTVADAAAEAVHRRLRSGGRRRSGRAGGEAVQSRRPRVGLEPRAAWAGRARLPSMRRSTRCWLYPTPDGVSDETAAACALVRSPRTWVWSATPKLQAGETLFVNGGTGGVGSMVVQMAKAIGARVVTTAGSDEKLAICRELGADLAINYKTDDVPARVKEFAPDGVNVWWETLREPDFDRTVSLLAPRGRMILMAGRDARPPFPVGPFYVKGCRLLRLRDVQRHAGRTASRGRGHQPLARRRQDQSRASTACCRSPKPPPPTGCRKRARSARAARWRGRSW